MDESGDGCSPSQGSANRKLLLDKGSDINKVEGNSNTTLMRQSENCCCDVYKENELGYMTLLIAIQFRQAPIIKHLLDNGCDVNMDDK